MEATKSGYERTICFRNEINNREQEHSLQLGAVVTPEGRYDQAELGYTLIDGKDGVEEYEKMPCAIIDYMWNLAGRICDG